MTKKQETIYSPIARTPDDGDVRLPTMIERQNKAYLDAVEVFNGFIKKNNRTEKCAAYNFQGTPELL